MSTIHEFVRKNQLPLILVVAVGVALLSFAVPFFPWYLSAGALVAGIITVLALRSPEIGIILIAFLLPFERIGSYELGGSTIRSAQIILIVTAVAWFVRRLWRGNYKFVKNPILIPLLLFIGSALISLPNSVNIERSVIILLYIVFTALLAFIIPNLVIQKRTLQWVVTTLLLSFVLVSVFGILQFVGDMSGLPPEVTGLRELYTKDILGFTRVQSTAYEPLYFANYLLIPVGILFALFLSGKNVIRSGWLITLFGLGMVNIVLTVSRGGYIAALVMIGVIAIVYFKRLFTLKNIIIFSIGTVAIVWVVFQTLGSSGEPFTMAKFQEHVLNAFYGASYNERVETFDQALGAWQEHPMVGVGVGSFGPYVSPHPYYIPDDGWRIVNNEVIEILAEQGIIGLTTFLIMIIMLTVRSIKAIIVAKDPYVKAITAALFGAFIGILAQYQTFSTLYIAHVWFCIGLLIACQNYILFSKQAATDKHAS